MRRSKVEMYPLVEDYETGGRSMEEICRDLQMSRQGFDYWLQKYKSENQIESGFIEVKVAEAVVSPLIEIVMGDAIIRLKDFPDAVFLRSLVLGC